MKYLKWSLIGGGVAWLLFRDQIMASLHHGHSTPPLEVSPGAGAPRSAQTTRDRLASWAVSQPIYQTQGGLMSTHHWNVGWKAVRGQDGPDPAAIGQGDGNRLLTIDEYLAAMQSAGLSGFRRMRGLSPAARAWRYS